MIARLPKTLSFYFARHYFAGFALVFGLLATVTLMFDAVELLRRSAGRPEIAFSTILGLSLMRLPSLTQQILPFAALFGSMLTLSRLTRSQELTVTRAAGVSVWQFLMPGVLLFIAIGTFVATAYNPISASLLKHFELAEAKLFRGQVSLLSVSSTGLWLRHVEDQGRGQTVIHAVQVFQENGVELNRAIFFFYDERDQFLNRLDAQSARLEKGHWRLSNLVRTNADGSVNRMPSLEFQTSLTLDRIQESFTDPQAMSFWDLPPFIETLERAGFSGVRHRLQWYSLLAQPFMLAAMVFVAALFSLRLTRRGGVGLLLAGGLLAGFALYAFSEFVRALAQSGSIHPLLAVWGPILTVTATGIWLLIAIEDG